MKTTPNPNATKNSKGEPVAPESPFPPPLPALVVGVLLAAAVGDGAIAKRMIWSGEVLRVSKGWVLVWRVYRGLLEEVKHLHVKEAGLVESGARQVPDGEDGRAQVL